jgi:hypothetical protein
VRYPSLRLPVLLGVFLVGATAHADLPGLAVTGLGAGPAAPYAAPQPGSLGVGAGQEYRRPRVALVTESRS